MANRDTVTKRCNKCGDEKCLADFSTNGGQPPDGHSSYCKDCRTIGVTINGDNRRDRLHDFVNIVKRNKTCLYCCEPDSLQLDFHHRDPTTKYLTVSMMVTKRLPISKIAAEISKCDLVCLWCHRYLTLLGYIPEDRLAIRRVANLLPAA